MSHVTRRLRLRRHSAGDCLDLQRRPPRVSSGGPCLQSETRLVQHGEGYQHGEDVWPFFPLARKRSYVVQSAAELLRYVECHQHELHVSSATRSASKAAFAAIIMRVPSSLTGCTVVLFPRQGTLAFDQTLTSFDTSRVTNMEGMFAYSVLREGKRFKQSLSSFDTRQVTNMAFMFMVSAHRLVS